MEKKKLKKLKINKMSEFPVISEKEQTQLKGGGYWDPELGYVTDEVTVYGDGDAYWKKEGRWDIDGCPGCHYGGGEYNTSFEKPLDNISNIWTHFVFHRKAYYK